MPKPSFAVGKIIPWLRRYVGEIIAELKKVVWPTKAETRRLTVMVLVVAGSVGVFLGVVDYGFTRLMELIIGG
ncbi:MAG: preprotein translocase subunit SecE [Dehalococcoidia bacterium]|jgi:preprotein translocase subunit SecE